MDYLYDVNDYPDGYGGLFNPQMLEWYLLEDTYRWVNGAYN
jgi:hypothetical protein